jgi:hypothetical protein
MLIEYGRLGAVKLGWGRRFRLYWSFGKPKGGMELGPPRAFPSKERRRALSGRAEAARSNSDIWS